MAKESFIKKYWEFMEFPLIILIVWTLIAALTPIQDYINKTLFTLISWSVTIFIFGYIGKNSSKEGESVSAKIGAYVGVISGFVGAVVSVILFYTSPDVLLGIIEAASQSGADIETVKTFSKIGIFFGLIISPIFSGAIGALISWIGALIFKKK